MKKKIDVSQGMLLSLHVTFNNYNEIIGTIKNEENSFSILLV